jgi:hypothetical protein
MFIPSSLTKLIGLRLMALTDGKLAPPHNSVTLHEAQQMPSLADRAAKERTEVLAQFGPQGTSPEGGAAARSNV